MSAAFDDPNAQTFVDRREDGFSWSSERVRLHVRRAFAYVRDERDVGPAMCVKIEVHEMVTRFQYRRGITPRTHHHRPPAHQVEVYVSPTGKSVRVWLDGRELR